MELAIRLSDSVACTQQRACSWSAWTRCVRMQHAGSALLASERQHWLLLSDKVARKVDEFIVVKPCIRIVWWQPWHCNVCFAGNPTSRSDMWLWWTARLCTQTAVGRVLVFAHYTLRMLTIIRLYPTRLETRTKESNMCASLRVIETCGHNESKDCPRQLRWEVSSRLHHRPTYSALREVWVRAYLLGPERWWTMPE